jgi:hypothetical protein
MMWVDFSLRGDEVFYVIMRILWLLFPILFWESLLGNKIVAGRACHSSFLNIANLFRMDGDYDKNFFIA